jgi:hypothetical protein
MPQQSTTEPRPAPKLQGRKTREQRKRIINKDEATDSPDIVTPGETLQHAGLRYPKPGPGNAYDYATGDRSIQRGIHDRGDHRK